MTRSRLIDPPSYVSLPPAAIYGRSEDLSPEAYRRLLQILGWMWVTKGKKPLGARVSDLAERWQVTERTVYHTLQVLGDGGYLNVQYSRGWVSLERGDRLDDDRPREAAHDNTPGEPAHDRSRDAAHDTQGEPAHNMPGEPAHDMPGEPAHTTDRERRYTHQAARGGTQPLQGEPAPVQGEHNFRAMPLHENAPDPGFRAMPLRNPNINSTVVVGVLDPSEKDQQQQHTISAVQQVCEELGLWADVSQELEADPWVSAERIRGWHRHLQRKKDRGECVGGRPIGSVQALVVANLRAHREPPPDQDDDEDRGWRRFVEGPYAHLIEH